MANVIPTQVFQGYDLLAANDTVNAAGIFIPLSSLPALSATEADPATGNGMEVFRSIVNATFESVNNLPQDDKPTKTTIVRQDLRFLSGGNYERGYLLKFELQFNDNAAQNAPE